MKQVVLRTLVYADIFDYPLTAEELEKRLIVGANQCVRPGQAPGFVPTKVIKTLNQLVDKDQVETQGKYYFLPGRQKIIGHRKKKEDYSKKKLEIAKEISNLIKCIPTVKFIGVTGSVAAGNADKDDDIDFFIIASNGWLWTTRLLVTILVSLTGKRRKPKEKQVKDKICLNLFVDESNLNSFAPNLFTAYELLQLIPLIDKKNTYNKFLTANKWVKEYLPNSLQFNDLKYKNVSSNFFNYFSGSRKIVEGILRAVQLWWMRKRKTTETVQPGLIAFHPEDISQEVMLKYKSRLKNYE